MATRKSKEASGTWPKVVKGTHLTVTTHESGRVELDWDDEQLLKEVRQALASVKTMKPNVKAKAVARSKKVEKTKILNSVEESVQAIEKAKKTSRKTVAKKTAAKKKTK